ncbi:hypothetical protein SUGI_1025390 [Cryptomeria japonica]|nr:hypothetical protein SUGI_1025390 [Cryptomeria japonica]
MINEKLIMKLTQSFSGSFLQRCWFTVFSNSKGLGLAELNSRELANLSWSREGTHKILKFRHKSEAMDTTYWTMVADVV